jgi:hypothetical protein
MKKTTFCPVPIFNCIEVCNRYIPSEESIYSILDEIDNEADRLQFVDSNNVVVWMFEHDDPEDSDDLKLRELLAELIQNYHRQGEVVGEDVTEIIQSLAVVNWFATMAPKMKETNTQDLRKDSSKLLQYFKKNKLTKFDKPRYSDLMRFLEYEEAIKTLTSWCENVLVLINKNHKLNNLVIIEFQIRKKIIENRDKSNNPYFNICYFCRKHFLSDKGGGHKNCGSEECERRYDAAAKKKSRSQPHELSKRAKPKKAFDGRPKFCDECGIRRVLYKFGHGNFCKPCCQTVLRIW